MNPTTLILTMLHIYSTEQEERKELQWKGIYTIVKWPLWLCAIVKCTMQHWQPNHSKSPTLQCSGASAASVASSTGLEVTGGLLRVRCICPFKSDKVPKATMGLFVCVPAIVLAQTRATLCQASQPRKGKRIGDSSHSHNSPPGPALPLIPPHNASPASILPSLLPPLASGVPICSSSGHRLSTSGSRLVPALA